MEREIKFRAWLASEDMMLYDKFYIDQQTGKCYYTEPYLYEHEEKVTLYDCGEEEPTLMQYTGLKDKNGKEIYEGDVLNVDTTNSDGNVVGESKEVVRFEGAYILPLSWITAPYVEIIGNIYENPELLNSDTTDKPSMATDADSSNQS